MDKLKIFLSTNVLLFDVLANLNTILCYSLVSLLTEDVHILSSTFDIILLKSTNFLKQEFMKNIYKYFQEVSLLRLLYLKLILI